MDDDLIIRRRDIKVRKTYKLNPGTKIEPAKKRKREKDNLRRFIQEEQEYED